MFQQPRDFRRRARPGEILFQQFRRRRDLLCVIRRVERFAVTLRAALLQEIINQANAVPLRDGSYLVLAVRVERGEGYLRYLRAALFQCDCMSCVANNQFPATMR